MYKENSIELLERDMQAAKPLLETLANSSRVVWLNQVPLIPASHVSHYMSSNEKLLPINRSAQRLLHDSGVVWWDDYAPAAAEYALACALWKRTVWNVYYANCDDDIHPGSDVISTGTQYLLNRLCRSNGTTCTESNQVLLARMGP